MRFFWLLAASSALVLPAQADPAREALAQIAKCADVAAAAERLACYDAAASGAKNALATTPAVEQKVAVQTQEEEEGGGVLEWFGLSKPVTKAEDFGRPPAPVTAGPKEVTSISSNVVELAKNAYGRSIFVLGNGQVWKQVDGDQTEVRDPRKGEAMTVSIEKGLLGSFSLRIEGRNGIVKVRRVK